MNQVDQKAGQKPVSTKPVGALEHLRRITSQDLLKGEREIIISHNGSDYRLRLTSNSKLILTK